MLWGSEFGRSLRPRDTWGAPVFIGTRVPLRNLIDYLEDDYSVEEFLEQFPSVTREQVNGALEALEGAVSPARPA